MDGNNQVFHASVSPYHLCCHTFSRQFFMLSFIHYFISLFSHTFSRFSFLSPFFALILIFCFNFLHTIIFHIFKNDIAFELLLSHHFCCHNIIAFWVSYFMLFVLSCEWITYRKVEKGDFCGIEEITIWKIRHPTFFYLFRQTHSVLPFFQSRHHFLVC